MNLYEYYLYNLELGVPIAFCTKEDLLFALLNRLMNEKEASASAISQRRLFQEIKSDKLEPIDLLPDKVEAYISKIEPTKCGKLVKELGYLLPLIKFDDIKCTIDEDTGDKEYQWPALGHLRRVRRKQACTEILHPLEAPPKKRKKVKKKNASEDIVLEILLGSVTEIDSILNESNKTEVAARRTKLLELMSSGNLQMEKRMLPGRPAKSQTEIDEWIKLDNGNGWWPTHYFEKQSTEYREKELELSLDEEWGPMRKHLLEAFRDAKHYQEEESIITAFKGYGAVIVCPESDQVVSRSFNEWSAKLQEGYAKNEDQKKLLLGNPLNTPAMLAIQGVSRIERQLASGKEMDSDSFKNGQYLCTGYDVYLSKEPGVFESMALVHSRVRRVIFCMINKDDGGLGGTGSAASVHELPGTNHRFRAFKCIIDRDDEIYKIYQDVLIYKQLF